MNTQTKQKHKFNFIDAIIIFLLLVIAGLLAAIFLLKGSSPLSNLLGKKGEQTHIYYAVEFNYVKDEMQDNIKPGDFFNYSINNDSLGEVVAVFSGDCEFVGVNDDGYAVASDYPGRVSLVVIVESDAVCDTYGYTIESLTFQVGAEIHARTNNFCGTGFCIGLKSVETDQEKTDFINDMKTRIYYAKADQIYYAVEFTNVKEEAKNSLRQNDKLFSTEKDTEIGAVVAVYPGDSASVGINESGSAVTGGNPGYISLMVIVEANAIQEGDRYSIGDFLLRTGDNVSMHTDVFSGTGRCIGLKTVGSNQQKNDFVSEMTASIYSATHADAETEAK